MARARKYRLAEIVERFGGELIGNPRTPISQVATLQSATSEQIGFLAHGKYRRQLAHTQAGAVILGRNDSALTDLPRIVCDDPYLYFARVSALFNPQVPAQAGVHRTAVVEAGTKVPASASIGAGAYIGRGVRLGKGVTIGPGCCLGDGVELGADSRLHARVTIYGGCRLGARVEVHSGVVIGADGFGIVMEGGRWRKIPQVGAVLIGDDVEIGANSCIDRGALDDTVLEDGVKLDNLVQVGHNVRIGAHTAIAGCTGIAGSTRIGRNCMIGGAASIVGHLDIADGVVIHAAAVVTKSLRKPGTYSGHPAEDSRSWAVHTAKLRRLGAESSSARNENDRLSSREKKA